MKIISWNDLRSLADRGAESRRRRANLNLHPELSDPVQRFFNAVQPGSYVRPHRHGSGRWETFVALAGAGAMLTFDDDGAVLDRADLSPAGPHAAAEVPAGVWHTIVALEPGTAFLEIKPGPYVPLEDKDFAFWSPPEGAEAASAFAQWFGTARPGDHPLPD
jgi:cupin fold WbuC family metalloprotein